MELHANELIERMLAAVKCLPHNSKAKPILTLLSQDLRYAVTLMENKIVALEQDEKDHHREIERLHNDLKTVYEEVHSLRKEIIQLTDEARDIKDPKVRVVVSMNSEQRRKADCRTPGGWGMIPPIKALREKTGLGLADAKHAVEAMMSESVKTYVVRQSALGCPEFSRYFTVALE